jgi:long-chain acyl-CoA synthetase
MPAPGTLVELAAGLARHGPRPALVAFAPGTRREWSYGELGNVVRELAQGLAAAGTAPGARVALCAGDGPEWLVAALAVLRTGAVVVPIDAQLPDGPLGHALADSAPRLIFTDGERAPRLARLARGARTVRLDAPETAPDSWRRLRGGPLPPPRRDAGDPAALFYTSGR